MPAQRSVFVAAGVAATAALVLAGCSSTTKEADKTMSSAMSTMTSAASSASSAVTSAMGAPAMSSLVGSGCAGYAEKVPSGPGSVAGLAMDPVATAASNSPVLSTLSSALSGKLNPKVNLVDTLNAGEYTVFAPTDEAFAKIDAATLEKLKTDSDLLTSILTYHVVSGQAGPDKVVGEHTTLQGAPVTVTGTGNDIKVNGAGLVCGGIKASNGTLYLIDTVLMPPATTSTTTSPTP